MRTRVEAPDAAGRGVLRTQRASEFEIPAEVVLLALGFAPPRLPNYDEFTSLAVDKHGCLAVDSRQMTNLPGVFTAGSIARWPVSMIDVMQDARKAAASIDSYLAARRASP